MASSVNKVTLLGNLGKDPDYRVTPNGTPVCKFTIATQEFFKNNNDQWEERAEWHNVECWTYTAEIANKYLKKGSKVYIEGKLKTEQYQKDGITRYITKVVATEIVLIQPKDSSGGNNFGNGAPYQNNNFNSQNNSPKPVPAAQESTSTAEYSVDMESEAWDDVPF